MKLVNQFYPTNFAATLHTALAAQPLLDLPTDRRTAIVDSICAEIRNKFFFFQGDAPSESGENPQTDFITVAYPFYALRKKLEQSYRRESGRAGGPQLYALVGRATHDKRFFFHEIPLSPNTRSLDIETLRWTTRDVRERYLGFPQISYPTTPSQGISIKIDTHTMHKKLRRTSRQIPPRRYMGELIATLIRGTFLDQPEPLKTHGARIFGSINDLINALQQDCVVTFKQNMDVLIDHLDRRALEFMRAQDEYSWEWHSRDIGRLTIYDRLKDAPSEQARAFRETATAIFHRLGITQAVIPDYRKPGSNWWSENPEDKVLFWEKIDEGMPPIKALEMLFPDNEKLWKGLLKISVPIPRLVGNRFVSPHGDSAAHMSKLLELAKPKTQEECFIMSEIQTQVLYVTSVHSVDAESGHEDVDLITRTWRAAHDMRSWQRFYDELYAKNQVTNSYRREIARQTSGIKDMMASMYEKIIIPCVLRSNPRYDTSTYDPLYKAFHSCILQNFNLRHLLQGSSYWHSERVNFGGRISSYGVETDDHWLPLLDQEIKAPNGVQFIPLTSKAALHEEADAMRHCVWSYTSNCVAERNHLFSLQDSTGNRLTTLQLTEHDADDGSIQVSVEQNNGRRNVAASQAAIEAAAWLAQQINSKNLNPDFQSIQARRDELAGDMARLVLGFEYRDLDICEAVYQLYIPCLPAKLQSECKSVAGFLHAIGFDEALRQRGFEPPPYPGALRPEELPSLAAQPASPSA
ncbi:MAG: hypothetical protein SFW62_04195 [Alphaproteobacteria bacterium]|nr:hypothetical protein [Alphaproteobacteria bacterium]